MWLTIVDSGGGGGCSAAAAVIVHIIHFWTLVEQSQKNLILFSNNAQFNTNGHYFLGYLYKLRKKFLEIFSRFLIFCCCCCCLSLLMCSWTIEGTTISQFTSKNRESIPIDMSNRYRNTFTLSKKSRPVQTIYRTCWPGEAQKHKMPKKKDLL